MTVKGCQLHYELFPVLLEKSFNPGDWTKAVEILSGGGDVNYEGATGSQDFNENGDVAGIINENVVQGGKIVLVGEIM